MLGCLSILFFYSFYPALCLDESTDSLLISEITVTLLQWRHGYWITGEKKRTGKRTHGLEGSVLSSQMQTLLLLSVSHMTPCNKVRLFSRSKSSKPNKNRKPNQNQCLGEHDMHYEVIKANQEK